MQERKLYIYKASAGAGKTFFLTESFLILAFRAPAYFRKVLAVTFTNKAAEEMKTRITEQINQLAENPDTSQHLAALKKVFPHKTKESIQKEAEAIRNEILHNYSLFSVSTIDSFVQKIIRAFTFEMNLRSNYNVQLDTESVMVDLRDRLLDKIEHDERLLKWLIKFAEYKIAENKSWDFNRDIEQLSAKVLGEEYRNYYGNRQLPDNLDKLRKKLLSIKKDFEKRMLSISQTAREAIENQSIDYTKPGNKSKLAGEYLLKHIPNGKYEPNKTLQKILHEPEKWANQKANTDARAEAKKLYEAVAPLLKEAFDLFFGEYPQYKSTVEVLNNFYTFGILADIAALLPDYREDNNELLISDTTLLLKELIQNNDAPFIYEKTGNRYSHILFDEFQDTSNFQWENFKPLIQNSLSAGNYNLIVGDIKQSIYGWRGGDRTLLLHGVKDQIGPENVAENNLAYNRRSAANIVRVNNLLFKRLPEILQNTFNAKLKELSSDEMAEEAEKEGMLTAITEAYKESSQKIVEKSDYKGYAEIKFSAKSKGENKADAENRAGEMTADAVNRLLMRGCRAGDIGILVRNNTEAQLLTDMLYAYQAENPKAAEYQVFSASSAELIKSPSVKLITAAFKHICEPEDDIARAELLQAARRLKGSEAPELHSLLSHPELARKFLPDGSAQSMDELKSMSLYELSEKMIDYFALRENTDDFEFIRNLQDLILNYAERNSDDLHSFTQWWQEQGIKEFLQISDKLNAVKILTVHKSKGLGIKHLIVPFANWDLAPQANTSFWAEDELGFFGKKQYYLLDYKKALANTVFRKSYFRHTLNNYTEALNLLYVALTRAVESLTVFVHFNPNSKTISNVGHLLKEALKKPADSNETDSDLYIDPAEYFNESDNCLIIGQPPEDSQEKTEDEPTKSFFENEYPGRKSALIPAISAQSEDFFIEAVEAVKQKVDYGSLMHKIFAEIKTSDDIDQVVSRLHIEGYITKDERSELSRKTKEIILRPAVVDWFKNDKEVITERSIITEEGLTRIPDRVVIDKDRITVIDFKFGKQRPEHHEQVLEYKELLQKIYARKVQAFLYYAETDHKEEVL